MIETAEDRREEASVGHQMRVVEAAPESDWDALDEEAFEIEPAPWSERLPAILLAALAAAWIATIGFAAGAQLATGPASLSAIASWIAVASAPLALIGVGWLMLRRTSQREAIRFGRTAEAMRDEARRLDGAAHAIAARIAETREALSHETDRLLALGEEAAGRLGAIGADMREAGGTVDAQSARLERAGHTARQDVEMLLAELPKAEAAARAAGDGMRDAGVGAHEQAASLETQLAALGERAREADELAGGATQRLAANLARIEGVATVSAAKLDETGRHIDAAVEAALERAGGAVEEARRAVDEIGQAMGGAAASAGAVLDEAGARAVERLDAAGAAIGERQAAIEAASGTAQTRVTALHGSMAALENRLGEAGEQARGIGETAAPLLIDAMARVRESADQASEAAREAIMRAIPRSAERLAEAARAAIETALEGSIEAKLAAIGEASDRAVAAAEAAGERLDAQVATIAASSSAVEERIAAARAETEAVDREGMARQVSLLIESLHSTAIDVTKLLSNEVTDTAWAAYLKGDRGVFTRRAVRLIEAGEAREIAQHYENDPEFHAQVNRYIHDFEAMLRRVLAAREGSPVAVTLLSSDNGKLYVALAQAIERLR